MQCKCTIYLCIDGLQYVNLKGPKRYIIYNTNYNINRTTMFIRVNTIWLSRFLNTKYASRWFKLF